MGWVSQFLLRLTLNRVLSVNVSSAISWLFMTSTCFRQWNDHQQYLWSYIGSSLVITRLCCCLCSRKFMFSLRWLRSAHLSLPKLWRNCKIRHWVFWISCGSRVSSVECCVVGCNSVFQSRCHRYFSFATHLCVAIFVSITDFCLFVTRADELLHFFSLSL